MFHVAKVDIRVDDGWNIAAVTIVDEKASNVGINKGKRPAVICHHGLGGSKERMFQYAASLAMAGYLVLVPDARGHGESASRHRDRKDDWFIDETTGIFPDLHRMVDWLVGREDVDPDRIALLGTSMGGGICLTTGLDDRRIKIVIAINPFNSIHDILEAEPARHFPREEWIMVNGLRFLVSFRKLLRLETQVSPENYIKKHDAGYLRDKVRLVYCKDDRLLCSRRHSEKIIEAAGLPPENILTFQKGDHGARGQETMIVHRVLTWLGEAFAS